VNLGTGNPMMNSVALNGAIIGINAISIDVPPLEDTPNVGAGLTAIKNLYKAAAAGAGIRQIWMQYPYMDQAQVQMTGRELKILSNLIPNWVCNAAGRAIAKTFDAIDDALKPRVAQVTDDLNQLIYNSINCPANNGAYVKGDRPTRKAGAVVAAGAGHAAFLCDTRTVVTKNIHGAPAWGAGDHQKTILGGMPHESVTGAQKLANSVRDGIRLVP